METSNQPGESLRAAREAAGWSIADVVHRTKFPRTVVEALERDDYTVFSSPTYAKSYLSQYARFLEIDPSRWLVFFEPAAFSAPNDVLSMIESPGVHEHHHHHSPPSPRTSGTGSMIPTFLLLILTAGLIYFAVTGYAYLEKRLGESIVNKESNVAPAKPSPESKQGPEVPAVANHPTDAPPTIPAETPEPTKPPRPIIVVE